MRGRLAIVLLACGCAQPAKVLVVPVVKDGPPLTAILSHEIPNATPIKEPLSRYGNPPHYKVFGQKYYVMASSRHYRAQGLASWYGTKFHGRRTSSGEPYDLLAMTAAHKHLPLPTYALVTNLDNQRKVIVKINDRGPFHQERLIDLSYAAAAKLDLLAAGTGRVEVRSIDPRDHDSYALAQQAVQMSSDIKERQTLDVLATQKAPSIYLQLGAYRSLDSAHKLQRKIEQQLKLSGELCSIIDKAGLYKVHLGPLKTPEQASLLATQLIDAHLPQAVLINRP